MLQTGSTTGWLLVLMTSWLFTVPASAQKMAGFRAGGGFAGDWGVAVGADVTFPVFSALGLRFGVVYGPKVSSEAFGVIVEGERALAASADIARDYLEASALAKAGRYVVLLFGPYVAVATSCNVNGYLLSERITESSCSEAGVGVSGGVDFGLKGGLGLEVPVTERLHVEALALMAFSLSTVTLDRPGDLVSIEDDTPSMIGGVLMVGVGIPFG